MKTKLKCKCDISLQENFALQGIWPDSVKDRKILVEYMINSRKFTWPYNTSDFELKCLENQLKASANLCQ